VSKMLARYEESLRGQRRGFAIVLAVWGLVVVGGSLGVARSSGKASEAENTDEVDMVEVADSRKSHPRDGLEDACSPEQGLCMCRASVDPFADK
jgi:hypothetical protein